MVSSGATNLFAAGEGVLSRPLVLSKCFRYPDTVTFLSMFDRITISKTLFYFIPNDIHFSCVLWQNIPLVVAILSSDCIKISQCFRYHMAGAMSARSSYLFVKASAQPSSHHPVEMEPHPFWTKSLTIESPLTRHSPVNSQR